MSVVIKYKGNTIASANTDTTNTLKTSGKYCEADIEVINTQDGGITPSGSISIDENGTYDVTEYASADVNVSGGTEIEHGAVWNTVNANGFPTEVTFYGTVIPKAFAYSYYTGWSAYMEKFNFHDEVTSIGEAAFHSSGIKNIVIPESVSAFGNAVFQRSSLESIIFNGHMSNGLGGSDVFSDCAHLKNVVLPKVQQYRNRTFSSCPALETVQLGSVGYGITQFVNSTFAYTSSQATANVTIYTSGSIADTVLANARNGLANSTIIIKASEDTTYNGTAYNAGDTMITSTP